jgi:hypothetical protein
VGQVYTGVVDGPAEEQMGLRDATELIDGLAPQGPNGARSV